MTESRQVAIETGSPSMDSMLRMFRRRVTLYQWSEGMVYCTSHGMQPMGEFCDPKGHEYFCHECLKQALGGDEPEKITDVEEEEESVNCNLCGKGDRSLSACRWCELDVCAECSAGAGCCKHCFEEEQFPPEQRAARRAERSSMRGS